MTPIPTRTAWLARFLRHRINLLLILFAFCVLPATSQNKEDNPVKEIKVEKKPSKNANKIVYGLASYYAQKFEGRQTANGEIFRHSKMTAACNILPLGTWIQITNLKNGKIIVVRTNDRLHPKTRRIIDLTYTGAQKLGFIKSGLTRVKIEILNQKAYKKASKR